MTEAANTCDARELTTAEKLERALESLKGAFPMLMPFGPSPALNEALAHIEKAKEATVNAALAELREKKALAEKEAAKKRPILEEVLDEIAALAERADATEARRFNTETVRDLNAVTALSDKMRSKLSKTRRYRGGWWKDDCTVERLSQILRTAVDKGDPVDVANFCAFISAKGGMIAPAPVPVAPPPVAGPDFVKALGDLNAQYLQVTCNDREYAKSSEYARGFCNGIICAHASVFDHEPDYLSPNYASDADAEPVADKTCTVSSPTAGDAVAYATAAIGPKDGADVAGHAVRVYGNGLKRNSAQLRLAYADGATAFVNELTSARTRFPEFASAHEGFAIIMEELDELKEIVWQKQGERNYADLRKETVQLGAMVLAFLVEIVDTENRR